MLFCEAALFITACKTARRKMIAKTGKGTSSETAVAYFKSIELCRLTHRVAEETPDQPRKSQFSSARFGRVHSAHIWHFTAVLICCDNLHLFQSKDIYDSKRHSSPFDKTFRTPVHFFLSFRRCETLQTTVRTSKIVSKLNIGQWSAYTKLGLCNDLANTSLRKPLTASYSALSLRTALEIMFSIM
jgi:hypothetical protein